MSPVSLSRQLAERGAIDRRPGRVMIRPLYADIGEAGQTLEIRGRDGDILSQDFAQCLHSRPDHIEQFRVLIGNHLILFYDVEKRACRSRITEPPQGASRQDLDRRIMMGEQSGESIQRRESDANESFDRGFLHRRVMIPQSPKQRFDGIRGAQSAEGLRGELPP